jgi:hypothetical protein
MFRYEKNIQRIIVGNVQRIQVIQCKTIFRESDVWATQPVILACILFILKESTHSRKKKRVGTCTLQDSLIAVVVEEINWRARLVWESVEIWGST